MDLFLPRSSLTMFYGSISKFRDLLMQCAGTSMSSKLIHSQKPFFSTMVVDAVMCLDQEDLNEALIGVKKVPGGGMQVSHTVTLAIPVSELITLNLDY